MRNRDFAAAGGHEGAIVFPKLRLFVVTCLDPRVDPAHFLGLRLSDAIVARNVGGRVTPEVINDVAFIAQIAESVLPEGPLFEVAVIHHTQCGAGALAADTFRRRYAQRIGADETALRDHAVLDPAGTVTHDVERLRSAAAIPRRVTVSGHLYDVTTGLVQTIVPMRAAGNGAKPPASEPRRLARRYLCRETDRVVWEGRRGTGRGVARYARRLPAGVDCVGVCMLGRPGACGRRAV